MAAEHGGAMAVGGEARGGSTCARKAAQARARLEGGRGGAAGAQFPAEVEDPRRISSVGAWARREAELGRSALAERRGSAGMSQRAHWLRQV